MLEEVAAELEHDPLPDVGEPEPRQRAEHPRGGVDADVADHGEQQVVLVALLDAVVDRVLDEMPADDRGRGGERREQGDQSQATLPLGGVGEEARESGVVLAATRQRTRLRRGP